MNTIEEIKFSISDFCSQYEQIPKVHIRSHLLKISLIKNFTSIPLVSIHTPKTSENQFFFPDVFRGYIKRPVA